MISLDYFTLCFVQQHSQFLFFFLKKNRNQRQQKLNRKTDQVLRTQRGSLHCELSARLSSFKVTALCEGLLTILSEQDCIRKRGKSRSGGGMCDLLLSKKICVLQIQPISLGRILFCRNTFFLQQSTLEKMTTLCYQLCSRFSRIVDKSVAMQKF